MAKIEFENNGVCVLEGDEFVKLVAVRTGALSHAAKVRFKTVESGLAKAGEDYEHTEGKCWKGGKMY